MDMFQIEGARPLSGSIRVSGSKNACLPIIPAALLADGTSTIHNVPDLRDIREMIALIQHLGAKTTYQKGTLTIDPSGFKVDYVPYEMMRKMRASFYAMGPMLARLGRARVSLPGGCAIGDRPVDLHLRGFAALGAQLGRSAGYVHARHFGLKGARVSLLGSNGTSVGATCNVLMAAALAEGTTVIDDAAKEPEVIDLGNFLTSMGARIEGIGTSCIRVHGVSTLRGTDWITSPDRIEAATFAIGALVTHGDLVLEGANMGTLAGVSHVLESWGAVLTPAGPDKLRVRRNRETKRAQHIITEPWPGFPTDVQPQMTVLFALTQGTSTVRDTIFPERFMHVAELNRLGAKIKSPEKGRIEIEGVGALEGAAVMASDLRCGAAMVLAAMAAHGRSQIRRVYHIERGYEDLVNKLRGAGACIERLPETAHDPGLETVVFEGAGETIPEEFRTIPPVRAIGA